jgi:Eukaryotic protein of unknown function (DUF842)
MSSAATQARVQELNLKIESEARNVLDGIDRHWLRNVAKSSYKCVLTCYDKAGTTGSSESLDNCSRNCQVKFQHANSIVQNVRWYFFPNLFDESDPILVFPLSSLHRRPTFYRFLTGTQC